MSTADDVKTTIIDASSVRAKPGTKEPREIVRHLGEGGMGEVFLCINPAFDAEDPHCKEPRTVAVKTLSPDLMQDREILKRFEAEARALSPIQHRNVVRLYDWGQFTEGPQTGQHYISMEFIEGLSLHKLGRLRRLSFPDVIDIAIQICEGLEAVHKNHVIHRDLKPANIMITHDGVAKIIDFGIAKPSSLATGDIDSTERGFKTKTGMIIGTVNYLAPETLLGAQATIQTDLYAVGLIVWEIINGATPFKTPSLAETMRRVSEESLTWSDATVDIAPPGFIKLINQVTAKDPAKRPSSAAELVQKLLKIRADAQWPSLLNRKSRLDLNVSWSTDLLKKLKGHSIADEDLIFILQGVEDHLITEKDLRLKSGQPIDVEESVISQTLNAFKSARYEAAMARQARLKTEMLAAQANPTIATERVAARTKSQPSLAMGTPPPVAAPIDKSIISGRIRAGNATQSRKTEALENSGSTTILNRIVMGTAVIGITAGIFFYSTHKFRETIGDRGPTHDGSAVVIAPPTENRVNEILRAFSGLKPGLRLIYDEQITEANGVAKENQERRDLVAIENGRLRWTVNEKSQISTSVLALPLDVFFNPINRDGSSNATEISNFVRPEKLEAGQTIQWTVKDTNTNNVENSACRPISASTTNFLGIDQKIWRIECDREAINSNGVLTHRTKELYGFASGSGFLTTYEIQIEEFKTDTTAARKFKRTGTLNTRFSTFKN